MTEESADNESLFSPEEMRDWLKVESRKVRLAADRRIKEATAIVEEYVAGRLTRDEANRRVDEHETKWGECADDPSLAGEIHNEAVSSAYRLTRSKTNKSSKRSR